MHIQLTVLIDPFTPTNGTPRQSAYVAVLYFTKL